MTQYEEIHKDKIEYQLQERYHEEIKQLQRLGFDSTHHTRELVFPFSAVIFCFLYPVLRFEREVFRVEKPLRYVLMNPLVLNYEYATYAHVFGMGVKFLTHFSDDTMLVTCNFKSKSIEKPQRKFYRYARKKVAIDTAWHDHKAGIFKLENDSRHVMDELTLSHFETLMQRDDKMLLFGFG